MKLYAHFGGHNFERCPDLCAMMSPYTGSRNMAAGKSEVVIS